MQYWKAHYRDALHDTDIEIMNTEEDYKTDPLSFSLDGVVFRGTSLGDFQLAEASQYELAKEKFCILKWGGYDTRLGHTFSYSYELQRYALDVDIPVMVAEKHTMHQIPAMLHIAFEYVEHDRNKAQSQILCGDKRVYRDDAVVTDFTLQVGEMQYSSTKKTLYFESAMNDLSRQIGNQYYMKCCFTCQYAEYSPYGNDDYGLMLCYRRHKDDCLKVNNKDDFFVYLEGKDFDGRQETYLCGEYAIRDKSCGYRGLFII